MRIIPAIDILNGRCVRLTKGDYNSVSSYKGSPLDVARTFEDHGFSYLHLVDLDGARGKKVVNYKVLESIASATSLKIDFGGGIISGEDLRIAFECGASQVNSGSTAVKHPELFGEWLTVYGNEKIILAADSSEEKIMVSGWMEGTDRDIIEFISDWEKKGISYVTCTDISKDGMLKGPAVGLYRDILAVSKINLIASGGVSSIKDVETLMSTGCEGAIIGKAIYEGKIKLKELSRLC
jgi:phosphoribosylformimino-5-aminoimidazole carboxamide ribotide isomerase